MINKSISAVFPAYNEAENLKTLIPNINKILNDLFLNYEIIIVNDGSIDNSGTILEELKKIYPRLIIVNHQKNLGYGKALGDGLASARNELVFFSDADNQFELKQLKNLAEHINIFGAVLGYRRHRHDNLIRNIYAALWKLLNKTLFGINVKDINCAFKLFHKSDLDCIKIGELKASGASINVEILYKLKKNGATFKEVPVDHFPRTKGRQTGGNPKVILKALNEILKLYFNKG